MFKKHTVFVLGAGASAPYGFPIGTDLIKSIDNLCERMVTNPLNLLQKNSEFALFEKAGFSDAHIREFKNSLKFASRKSIDRFLESRTGFIDIGKCLISHVLLKSERESRLFDINDWYQHIWEYMNQNTHTITENRLAFVTFNYDRSLEYFLMNALAESKGIDKAKAFNTLKAIPIIHVHGKIGPLNEEDNNNYTSYGDSIDDYSKLLFSSKSIKIVHELNERENEFNMARSLLFDAEKVIILGLGYDPVNLNRLSLNEIKNVSGTTYGLTRKEIDAIINKYPNFRLVSNNSYKCLEYIREEVDLD